MSLGRILRIGEMHLRAERLNQFLGSLKGSNVISRGRQPPDVEPQDVTTLKGSNRTGRITLRFNPFRVVKMWGRKPWVDTHG